MLTIAGCSYKAVNLTGGWGAGKFLDYKNDIMGQYTMEKLYVYFVDFWEQASAGSMALCAQSKRFYGECDHEHL